YRWIGPVRIVKIHGTDSKSQIDVVETYPGYEIVRRTVHVSRLRLYTYLEPEDNAEYAARIAQPDIEAELDLWKNNRLLQRKPRGEQPTDTGLNRRIMKALYPDFTDEDVTNPEFKVERILKFRIRDSNYQYLTKWVDWSNRYNTWQDEEDMHPDLITEYWETFKAANPRSKHYKYRQAWLRQRSKGPKRTSPSPPPEIDTPVPVASTNGK
ncbi:hypothetical protein HDU76_011688, partial [Blyttiomyces sp. JEL0837]